MSETWLHVIKNAAIDRKPKSPKLLDNIAADAYLDRILESSDASTRRELLSILDQLDPNKLGELPGLQYLVENHHSLRRQVLIDIGATNKGPRSLDDIYQNWI